jgi:maltose O-acetyltransferase
MSLQERLASARGSWWLRDCERVEADTQLHGRPSIIIYGGRLRIGARCAIGSVPISSHFVAGPGALLAIGDGVVIGHGAAIAAFERVEIGAGTCIGPFAIIMDTNFHGGSGDQSVHHDCRPVVIGSNCRIGSRVTITRGVTIGDGAEVLAGSVVSGSVPSGVCVGGARARILGRAGDPATRWEGVAAQIPILIMETFRLSTVPDGNTEIAIMPHWDEKHGEILAAIVRQFGVKLPGGQLTTFRRVADLVEAVERERRQDGARK